MKKKKKTGKIVRNVLIVLAVLALAAGFLLFRSGFFGRGSEERELSVSTSYVRRGDISSSLSSSGTLSPKDTYTITSLVEGEIISADFEEGDQVEKDQVLYRINSSSMDSQITSTENSLARAEKAYDDAVSDYNEALSKYSGNTCKSTKSGYIKELKAEAGDKISNNAEIGTVYSDDTMRIKVPFLSVEAEQIKEGDEATLVLSQTGEELTGVVTAVSGLDEVTSGGRVVRTVTIEVQNPGGLSSDYTANVYIGNYAYSTEKVPVYAESTDPSSYSAAGVGPGYENLEEDEEPEILRYETKTTVSFEGFASVEEGTFEPVLNKSLQASLTGASSVEIEEMLVKEGDYITEGTPLFRIVSSDVEDILETYKDAIDSAEERVESAQTSVDNALDVYDNYTITAPISGQVIVKNTKAGDKISSGNTAMAVIYDLSELTFEMSIDELDVQKIKVGQKVVVTADAFEGQTFEGTVTNVSLQSSYSNGVTNYPVTVTISDTGDLLPGMNVDGEIILEESEDVLLIPIGALQRGNQVYVRDDSAEEDRGAVPAGFRAVQVETGITSESYIEILSGDLSEGDEIYVNEDSGAGTFNINNIMNNMGGGMGGGMPSMNGGGMPSGGGMGGFGGRQ